MNALTHDALTEALARHSPRHQRRGLAWRAALIHGATLLLWGVLLTDAYTRHNSVLAWSVGIAYVCYDTVLLLFVAGQTWRLLRRPRPGRNTPLKPVTVGAIVAAHNEARVLPVTLAALLSQKPALEQIVIADDGSSDGTAALLAQDYGIVAPPLGELSAPSTLHPQLHWLRLPHGGKARALNHALQVMWTDTVVTVDGDTLLEPGAMAAVRDAFDHNPQLVAATGVITPVCSRDLKGRLLQGFQTYEYIRNFLSRFAWARFNALLLVSGAFAGFRRAAILQVGGFDPDCMVEDYELIHRLHRHSARQGLGWEVAVLGGAQARTDAPSTVAGFLKQRRRWFGGFLQTQYWYRDMVGNGRYGWLGRLMLPVKAGDTFQPLYGFTAFVLLLVFAVTGQLQLVGPVLAVMGAKVAIDLVYLMWSLRLYRRWTGDPHRGNVGVALLAALAEPFTFQLLRHTGALLGWWSVLTGRASWGRQSRKGLGALAQPRKLEQG
jgi:cellulose synthase/poly-beta-1,6-N-acetylglucosamine synthase-like glycosyltransferase